RPARSRASLCPSSRGGRGGKRCRESPHYLRCRGVWEGAARPCWSFRRPFTDPPHGCPSVPIRYHYYATDRPPRNASPAVADATRSSACDVLCAGIVVADHVSPPISHMPAAGELVMAARLILTLGGCAANVAVGLRNLGVAAAVVGRVGDDLFGRIVREMLTESGVDVRFLQATPSADTSQTLIVNVAGQDRRFIHTFGANAVFRAADVPRDGLAACQVVYLGGYLLMGGVTPEETAAVFAEARRLGAKTVLDVVTPPGADYLARLAPVLPHVDVFLPNA